MGASSVVLLPTTPPPTAETPSPVASSLPQFGWHWSREGKAEFFPRRQFHGSSNSFPPRGTRHPSSAGDKLCWDFLSLPQRRGPDSFEGVESEWYQGKTWSSELCPLRKSQHRLLQIICKGKRQRMLQGRQFVVPRSPGAVSCGTDPPPSQAEPCLGCPGAARPQTGASSSFLLLQAPSGAQAPACTGCRNSRMPGYHRDTHEVQTQGHRCTNPVMENVPLGRFRIRRFFFLK